jgi:DNA-binding transcriptional LysR family regulator
MNVQQLRYLVAVSDFGSVSAAARSLDVTQPVISRSVRAFEVEHGVTVFGLRGGRLVPTEAGKAVVDAARDALAAIDTVEQKARAAGGQAELLIASTPTNGLLLTRALSELGRCEPGLALRVIRASDSDDVIRRVQGGEAEIGFSELIPWGRDQQLTSKAIAEVEVVLVSPTGTDLPVAVSWDDVVTQPLIMPPAGSDRRELIIDMATKTSGTTPHASLVTDDRGTWIAAAQAGMGSFLSYLCVMVGIEGVEIRPFIPPQTVTVGFIQRTGPISRAAARLMDLAQAAPASLLGDLQHGSVGRDDEPNGLAPELLGGLGLATHSGLPPASFRPPSGVHQRGARPLTR